MISTLTDSLNYYQQLIENSRLSRGERETIFIFSDVKWQDYQTLSSFLGDKTPVLLQYLQGTLEIMSPSSLHEFYKENIGILLEAYFQEKKIRFYSLGSTTFRSEASNLHSAGFMTILSILKASLGKAFSNLATYCLD